MVPLMVSFVGLSNQTVDRGVSRTSESWLLKPINETKPSCECGLKSIQVTSQTESLKCETGLEKCRY